ncbi:beta strand repeat-containing protein [Bradyrhizobium canariense]|uniref:beta strand repeat-containing protein n=1 Tax=Bradyrhizobium canariense TaxID=255045 RepID=UPI001B89E532|nr:RHS repeat protein [Bradyrhizobium canariense]MBR0954368.1 RHS repeat protein [Bradyrhizobium canariense]
MATSSVDQTLHSASSFTGSIGVNTHVAYSWGNYNNLALMEDDLKYLGVTKLRDALATSPGSSPVMSGLAADGYQFDLIVSSNLPVTGSSGLANYLSQLDSFVKAHPGSLIAVEGLNEANTQPFSYNGSSDVSAAAQFQIALYTAIKGDATLSGVSVYNLSLGYTDTNDYAKLGNLTAYSDYANSHAYAATTTTPATAVATHVADAESVVSGKPTVITETGYSTLSSWQYLGVDQAVQAKSILNTLVDAFKDGVSTTYLYELLDHGTDAGSQMGLFNADGTPKLAATAIHNLTTILADDGTGSSTPTSQLGYNLTGLPASGNSMVLTKSNGAYDLVVWAEPKIWDDATDSEVAVATTQVTVNLGGVHHSVVVYDPMSGTSPIASYTDVSQIVLPLSDHPLIIEIDAPARAATPPDSMVNVSDTAADIVAQLSDLNDSTTLKTITLTDTHVLPVASETTMNYIISHYGKALAAIQGGYSFSVTTSSTAWSLTKVFNASGSLLSTTTSNFSNGLISSKVTVNSDGSTDSFSYTAGVATREVIVKTDGSKETKTFGAGGVVSDTLAKTDGSSSTTLYSAGVKTKLYVNNADGSHDTTTYNVKGASYVTETQHSTASGVVTSVTRYHSDGTLDFSQTIAADGSSKVTTLYDAAGHKTTVIKWTPTSVTTDKYNTSGTLLQEIVQNSAIGTTTTTNYNGALLASVYIANADGSKESKLYNSSGVLTSDTIIKVDGSSSNTVYSSGVKTKLYVTNADGSHDTTTYNIKGASYVTETQHSTATGAVTSVARYHTDGTFDYSQVINSDGSKLTTLYDATGHKTTTIKWSTAATVTDKFDSSGKLLQEIVQNSNGSVTTTNYNGALLASVYILNADGSKETKLYDSAGSLASDTLINTNGSSSSTVYTSGVKSKLYVTNADGSHDTTTYNIKGATYVTETQHSTAAGAVTSLTRYHTDGTLDYSQVINTDGSKLTTLYDATGHKTTTIKWSTAATVTDKFDSSGKLLQEIVQNSDGAVTTTNYNGTLLASVSILNADGSKESKLYDSAGRLASDVTVATDGSSSNLVYTAGVKTALYVTNVDGSHDTTTYNIAGKSYVSEFQHATASGAVTEVIRYHADGSLDYQQNIGSDGTKVTDVYDSTGHKLNEVQLHTDGASLTLNYNTSGATTQAIQKDANGDTTTTNYSGGNATSVYEVHTDGWKETKLFDTGGNLTNDTVYNTDGSTSSTVYSSGVKTASYVTNADGTHDNSFFNITGKSYVTEYQHTDAAGTVLSDTRLHADGSFDFKQVINSDGSKVTDNYDSAGTKTQETIKYTDGSSDVFIFSVSGKPGAIEHDSRDTSGTLVKIDMQNADGTHNVTAVTAGQTLQGSANNDQFQISPGSTTVVFDHGNDKIIGFHAGTAANHDVVEISKALVADYAHLQVTQSGSNAVIQISATDQIVLQGINVANLDHGNFLFV